MATTEMNHAAKEDILIRPLQKEDIAPLAEIESRSFSMPWSAKDFEELLSIDYAHYFVAELDGKVVGSVGMRVVCGEGDIDNVVVSPEYRGRGIAQRLLQELLAWGRANEVTAFTLEVRVSNAPAIHVYEKAGFVSCGIRPGFYDEPKEDAMILWLYV